MISNSWALGNDWEKLMAVQAKALLLPRLKQLSDADALVGVGIVAILAVMLLPLPSAILDVLLAINISFALITLLSSIYAQRPLDFAIYPSLLLLTTLFRLALNVSSTRLILMRGHEGMSAAGHIIGAFGNFVVGGNYVIGLVIFVILVIVNFVVITKGTERISEVTARFTLDAMPGKQMAIDADLNSGMIEEREARRRRGEIRQEADFYGTMDGVSKFVRGDAVAGILITLINIIGGLAIGVLQNDMELTEALQNYTLLTVGDGLVSQIPALIISSATGILVSRAATDMGMGRAFGRQFQLQPRPLAIAGGMLWVLGIVPGFPMLPLMLVGSGLVGTALLLLKQGPAAAEAKAAQEAAAPEPDKAPGTELPPLLDTLELEVGHGLIYLVDDSQGGDLLTRIKSIRHQLALDFGIVVPALHVRHNLQLKVSEYRLLLKGNMIAHGELMPRHLLALGPNEEDRSVQGIRTLDPAFGLPALWIQEDQRQRAEQKGFTVIDAATVIATHLTELFKKHAHEMLSRQTVQRMLDHLSESQPRLVEELCPTLLALGLIQKVLQNLIREQVSIRDLQSICEALADHAAATKDPDILTEYVRQALVRSITRPYESEGGKLLVLTLHQELEDRLSKSIQKTEQGSYLTLEPMFINQMIEAVKKEAQKALNHGHHPVVLSSPLVRRHLRKLLERFLPEVVVISHSELSSLSEIQAIGTIRVGHAS